MNAPDATLTTCASQSLVVDMPPTPSEGEMTETPESVDSGDVEIDEAAVEPEKTTNIVAEQDDVEIADDQTAMADPGYYEDYDASEPLGGAQ